MGEISDGLRSFRSLHTSTAITTFTTHFLQSMREQIWEICGRHGAHDVRLFGSVARGENTSQSDVDFLVRFDLDRSLLDHAALIADLEDLLSVQVDVVSEAGMHERFRARVLREAILL